MLHRCSEMPITYHQQPGHKQALSALARNSWSLIYRCMSNQSISGGWLYNKTVPYLLPFMPSWTFILCLLYPFTTHRQDNFHSYLPVHPLGSSARSGCRCGSYLRTRSDANFPGSHLQSALTLVRTSNSAHKSREKWRRSRRTWPFH